MRPPAWEIASVIAWNARSGEASGCAPCARAGRRPGRGRGLPSVREDPGVRGCTTSWRLRAERRLPRPRDLCPRGCFGSLAWRAARRHRPLRTRGRLAALRGRAGVAGALASLAWLAARRVTVGTSSLSVRSCSSWAPTSVLEPGFQLSFAAVAAIFVGVPRVRARLQGYPLPTLAGGRPRRRDRLRLVRLRSSSSLRRGSAVHRSSTSWQSLRVLSCWGSAPRGCRRSRRALWRRARGLAGWAAAWLELVARLVASLPSAQIGATTALLSPPASPSVLAWRHRPRRPGTRGPAAVLGSQVLERPGGRGWTPPAPPVWDQPAGLRVTFLDVGQGDSVLPET